jgi:toxin ParE1/3/4
MSRFILTGKARDDLRAIALFTEERWGVAQRNLYIKQFDDTFRFLAATPQAGNPCDYIREGYRKFPQGSHVIFYTTDDERIVIVRILHKHMDIDSNLPSQTT